MTDKVLLIKEEIERRYNCEKCYSNDREANVAAAVLQELLLFIDSLPEEHNEDLEEAAQEYSFNIQSNIFNSIESNMQSLWKREIENAVKAGAEWQKKQMMKDAVDATIFFELNGSDGSLFQVKSDRFRMNGVKISDKIKVIPIKN